MNVRFDFSSYKSQHCVTRNTRQWKIRTEKGNGKIKIKKNEIQKNESLVGKFSDLIKFSSFLRSREINNKTKET